MMFLQICPGALPDLGAVVLALGRMGLRKPFYTGDMLPVFLITVFSKGEKANLSKAERNQLASLTKLLAAEYETR
jgi:hypothetical protein